MTPCLQGVPGVKGDQGEPGKRGLDGVPVSPRPQARGRHTAPTRAVRAGVCSAWVCLGQGTTAQCGLKPLLSRAYQESAGWLGLKGSR